MQTHQLSLYQFDSCPFCQRVRATIERLGLDIELRDVRESAEHLRELEAATGRRTVPVLRIEEADGKARWLPESLDIIQFLEQHFGK